MKTTIEILAVVLLGLAGLVGWQEWRIRKLCLHADVSMRELQRLTEKNDLRDQRLEFVAAVLTGEEMAREDQRSKARSLQPSR